MPLATPALPQAYATASTALGVSYALERRRSVPIWLAKLILAGPAALWELRLLEPLAPVGDEGRE